MKNTLASQDVRRRSPGRPPKSARRRLRVYSQGLFLGSKPQQCEPARNDIDVARRVNCCRYSNCVTYAAAEGWTGFSCVACPIDEPLSRAAQRDDFEGLAAFLRALADAR